jgi:hypothetical protein
MRVCLVCAGAMPDPVRDDALYCKTSCKLKAQRKRKKECVPKGQPCRFDPVAPLGDGPQLCLPFMGRGQADGRQLSFGFMQAEHSDKKQRRDASSKNSSSAREEKTEQPQQQGWAARWFAKLSQPSKGDIV